MVDDEEALSIAQDAAANGKQSDNNNAITSTDIPNVEMASVADLFSFAESTKSKLLIAGGFLLAMVSGAVFPGNTIEAK